MTPEQVKLVQESFGKVAPIAEQAAGLFYQRLFELDPSLRGLFKGGDMKAQGQKLMQALTMVVKGLDRPGTILPGVVALGQRHVDYGVKDEHYATVGQALLWTLERGLGSEFTPGVKEAWSAAYNLLATVMKEAAAKKKMG